MSWKKEISGADGWHGGPSGATSDGDAGYSGGDARMMTPVRVTGAIGASGGGCRNCGEEGHFARECTQTREGGGGAMGACFNCGEEGHSKKDCTKPRIFTGICRVCNQEGHPAAECPEKPAETCKNCKQEGHMAAECTGNRARDLSNIPTLEPDDAWDKMAIADESRDLDDIRVAINAYTKAVPDCTYEQLETSFRHNNFNTHLIASEKEVTDTYTLMNLQGKIGCTYTIGLHFSFIPKRGGRKEGWPKSPEENLERLKDAGTAVEKLIPQCNNCDEFGHTSKFCTEEKVERVQMVVKCVNCEEIGHRARDCTVARKDRFACRNCDGSGHTAAECPEPRSAKNVTCKVCDNTGHFAKDCPDRPAQACRNCGQEGHMSKECDQPRNPATVTCRNCEEKGHFSKECPKPRDYTKVKCQNCGEMGHTKVRCKAEPAEGGNGDFQGASAMESATSHTEPAGDWNAGGGSEEAW